LTYLWQLNPDAIYASICEDLRMVLEKLENRKKYEEENDFYICKTCGTFTFNEVADTNFQCPLCGNALEHFDNETLLNALNSRITQIKKSPCYE
jgi:transcription initiation factor TFIIE subunit alpha